MVFTRIYLANPNQKMILIEQAHKYIIEICKKFQDNSGSTNSEVNALLRETVILCDKRN